MENMDMSRISIAGFLKKANKGQSVRRCLFGPVDHEENSRFLKQQIKLQDEESKAKWNFDFETMTPLSGKYAWEKVSENDTEEIPSVYAMPQLTAPSYYRSRTPLGLSSRMNSNVITKPEPKTPKKANCRCVDVSPLRGEPVPKDAVTLTQKDTVVSSQVNNKSHTATSSTSHSISVQAKKSPMKRKLSQTDMTDYFVTKKHRSAFTSLSNK